VVPGVSSVAQLRQDWDWLNVGIDNVVWAALDDVLEGT
jgi:hypothetical protein